MSRFINTESERIETQSTLQCDDDKSYVHYLHDLHVLPLNISVKLHLTHKKTKKKQTDMSVCFIVSLSVCLLRQNSGARHMRSEDGRFLAVYNTVSVVSVESREFSKANIILLIKSYTCLKTDLFNQSFPNQPPVVPAQSRRHFGHHS